MFGFPWWLKYPCNVGDLGSIPGLGRSPGGEHGKELRDAGNSVIVVEHDEDMMRSADYIVDVGPKAGRRGGQIVAAGSIEEIMKSDSITADYLCGRRKIEIPETLRPKIIMKMTVYSVFWFQALCTVLSRTLSHLILKCTGWERGRD